MPQHVGLAPTEAELQGLAAAARQRLVTGQGEFDLERGPSEILSEPV